MSIVEYGVIKLLFVKWKSFGGNWMYKEREWGGSIWLSVIFI